jgi:hypothetical protein
MSSLKIWLFIVLITTYLLFSSCNLYKITVSPATNIIEQYKTLYVDIHLNQTFDNPFNPNEIKVDAVINIPTGRTITVPCFYMDNPSGKSFWQARFAPREIGT